MIIRFLKIKIISSILALSFSLSLHAELIHVTEIKGTVIGVEPGSTLKAVKVGDPFFARFLLDHSTEDSLRDEASFAVYFGAMTDIIRVGNIVDLDSGPHDYFVERGRFMIELNSGVFGGFLNLPDPSGLMFDKALPGSFFIIPAATSDRILFLATEDNSNNNIFIRIDSVKMDIVPTPLIPLIPGILFSWPLDEGFGTTAGDIAYNGHDGKLTNGPVWYGQTLLFDGIDDYVNAGRFDLSVKALTLSAWAQPEELENCSLSDCRILSKATGTASQDHYLMLSTIKVGNQTRLRFRLKTNGSTSTLVGSSGDLENGVPFHVAAVYDGATMRLYKDGIEVGSLVKTGNIDNNYAVETWIGGNPNDATSRPWEGSISDVRIYQKALSLEEVNMVKEKLYW